MTVSFRRSASHWGAFRLIAGSSEGRNIGWLAAEQVLRLVVGMGVGVLVARHLGASDYGRLAVVIAAATLLTPFVTAGEGFVVRDLAAGVVPSGAVLGSAVVLSSALTLLAAGALIVVSQLFPGVLAPSTHTMLIIVLAGTAVRPLGSVDFWFQAHLKASRASLARNVALLAGATARVSLVLLGAGAVTFAWAFSGEAALATALLLLSYQLAGQRVRSWRLNRAHMRQLARRGLPLLVASLSIVVYLRIDQVMLGSLAGVTESGIYAVAVSVSEAAWFLPVAIGASLTPRMSRLWEEDRSVFYRRLEQLFLLACATSYVVLVISLAVGPWIIPLAYGEAYADVVPTFAVLTLASPFVFIGVMQSIWTVNADRQGIALARTGGAAIINVALNFLLLPWLGAIGAAITTVTSYATAGLLLNFAFAVSRPIGYMQLRSLALRGLPDLLRNPPFGLQEQDGESTPCLPTSG